ncbi:hypothetical protein CW304_27725 [Bacillus sp. UFRGS-B20]|nr:hypothetical protein CW304_27725 [Bacillus sp. UFRGS-B20]
MYDLAIDIYNSESSNESSFQLAVPKLTQHCCSRNTRSYSINRKMSNAQQIDQKNQGYTCLLQYIL